MKGKALSISPVADSVFGESSFVPEKVIFINQCKCVFVQKGTPLRSVADQNKLSLARLLEFNEMSGDGELEKDQLIYLQLKADSGAHDFYKVGPGESLHDVAQRNGIRLKCLMDYNKIGRDDPLPPGKLLVLRPGQALPGKRAEWAVEKKVHTVSAKEGLYSIAKRYGVTVQQLREWNKLSSDELGIGQKIIVSQ
jgi:LysM repeat protein